LSYADFFKSLIRQCAEYAVANEEEINHFLTKVSFDLDQFTSNWVMCEKPTDLASKDDVKHFVVTTKHFGQPDTIPLYNLLQ